MSWKKTLLICLAILLGGAAVTALIFSTEPTAQRGGATHQTAMLVDVTGIQEGNFRPTIRAMGTVRPVQDITLSPQVGGEIISLSPNFTPGSYVQKGDTLLRINPEDYENTLLQRKSDLQQATSDLTLEMGLQEAARKEYQSYGDTLSAANRARILRKPQLKSVKARVQSARAAVEQAKLNLKRTTITAPFDAHILARNINVGSKVAVGENLGRLVGLDEYWVEATVPVSKLRWLTIPEGHAKGTPVQIHNQTAWPEDTYRTGYIDQLIGSLEGQTRMARLLISVPDPQAHQPGRSDRPRLMIGAFVEAHIQADQLRNVIRLNRDFIRENETVWVMDDDNKLDIRDVDIAFTDAQYAYIKSGLQQDARVVTSNLSTVTEGAPLRLGAKQDTLSQ